MSGLAAYVELGQLRVRVRVGQPKTCVVGYDEAYDAVRIALAARPEQGRANAELLRYVSRELGCPVRLKRGATSRLKVLELLDRRKKERKD